MHWFWLILVTACVVVLVYLLFGEDIRRPPGGDDSDVYPIFPPF